MSAQTPPLDPTLIGQIPQQQQYVQPGHGQVPPPGWGQPGFAAPQPPKKAWYKKKLVLIPAALVGVVIVANASNGGSNDTTNATNTASDTPAAAAPVAPAAEAPAAEPPAAPAPAAPVNPEATDDAAKNVTIDSCSVNTDFGLNMATVGYTIVNPTSKSSMYMLDIKVIDSTGAAVGTANGIENNVLPNRPSKGEAVGSVSDSSVGPFTCEIGDITRMSAQN